MNLFYTWGAILGPFVAGAIYDRTQSYELVFTGITIALPDFHRDDGALNQAVGETRNVRPDTSLTAFARLIRLFCYVRPQSGARIVKRGSNPSSDQPLPPPLAARSREGGRAWNEFLTNHCGNRQH